VHLIFLHTIFLDWIMKHEEIEDHSIQSEAPQPQQSRGRKWKCLPSAEEQLAVDTAVKIINDATCKNSHSAFCENIANKLAAYDIFTRSQVEYQISTILYEEDIQALSTQSIASLSTCASPQSVDFDS
jgi:hypothetical protein